MPSDATNEATRREWRKLGFFYDRDDQAKVWNLIGSRAGLLSFRDALLSYATDARNASQAEHEHHGPYSYLKVMTWPEAAFDRHAIRGPVMDLAQLAALIEVKLSMARAGSTVRIREEFAVDSPYALVLDLREDGFDPAAADPLLATGRPLALDPLAERGSQTESAFITRPAGAPVYHGFEALSDVVVGDFTFGKITVFEVEIAMKATPSLSRPPTAGPGWAGLGDF